MNAADLFLAYVDVAARMQEHEDSREVEQGFGFDPDQLDRILGDMATKLDEHMIEAGTPYWPPRCSRHSRP